MISFVKSKSGLQDALRKRPSNEQAQQWKLPVGGHANSTNYSVTTSNVDLERAPDEILGEGFDSQSVNDLLTDQMLLSMSAEERRGAGLSHMENRLTNVNSNKMYDRSYPSTTSGRTEEDEQESTQPRPSLKVQSRVRIADVTMGLTTDEQHLERSSRRDGVKPSVRIEPIDKDTAAATPGTRSLAEVTSVERSATPTPIARSKRKAPGDEPPTHAPVARQPLISSIEYPRPLTFNTSDHSSRPPLNSPSIHGSPNNQVVPITESASSAPDGGLQADIPIHATDDGPFDYEETELYAMDFTALQEEPFDQCTSEISQNNSSQNPSAPLKERLQHMSNEPIQDQQRLFAALDSSEREEAGAWFAERFREVTKKLDFIRADRRELARRFEEEVAQRHQAIAQETGSLDATLREMKTKGVLVLTPKRN